YRHAQLIVGIAHHETGETGEPGSLARSGHAAGDAHKVGFRDTDVKETRRKLLGEMVRAGRVVDIAIENHNVRVLFAELRQAQAKSLADGFAHFHVVSPSIVRSP